MFSRECRFLSWRMHDASERDSSMSAAVDVVRETRSAVARLSAEARKLKTISELQMLKEKPVQLSVDKRGILDSTRRHQAIADDFDTLHEMMALLNLLASAE
jgi:hypothetical protein